MANVLRLILLGGMEITLGGSPVTAFRSDKARALLCYLAVTGRPHTRDALASLLWGNSPEDKARASLRTTLSSLRRQVTPHLITTRQTIAFGRKAPYWLDVAVFSQHIDAALKKTDGELTEVQVNHLQEAATLYGGDFLAGFHTSHAPAFEEWVLGEREWLRRSALQALHLLIDYYTARGAYPAGIDAASHLLALEPWQEEAHRQLFYLLALSGRRSEALAQYETCCRVLADELGVEPAEETTALYEKIQQYTPSRIGGLTLPRHNLPPQVTPFIGREAEVAQLQELLLDPTYRLVTLVGPGGVGKTRLALRVAEKIVDHFAQGVWFVPLTETPKKGTPEDLNAPRDEDTPTAATAKALNITFSGGRAPRAQLLDYLQDKEMLLLLDNLEHLPDTGIDFILEVLHTTSRITFLVTTRQRLNLQAEYAISVKGLPVPDALDHKSSEDVESLSAYSSVQLFSERADRAPGGFTLSPHNLPAVVQVCRSVEGLPLAIELAAALVERLSPTEIAQVVQQDLDQLATTMQDVPPRHRSMRAVFGPSWSLLPERAKTVLAQVSVFRGGFDREAAAAIIGATPSDLQALEERSLLHRNATRRYGAHEVVRQFAAERLGQDQVPVSVQAQHSAYYIDLVARQEIALYGQQPQIASAVIQREWDNIYEAWRWAATNAEVELLEHGLEGLSRFLLLKGLFHTGQMLFGAAVEGIGLLGNQNERTRKILGRLLAEQARFLNTQASYSQAQVTAQTAIDLTQAIQDQQTAAHGYLHLGRALGCRGNYQASRTTLQQGLAYTQEARSAALLDDGEGSPAAVQMRRHEAEILNELGEQADEHGSLTDADAYYEQALGFYRELGDRRGETMVLYNQGIVFLRRGHYEQAYTHLSQSLHRCRELGDRQGEGYTTGALGRVLVLLGKYAEAKTYHQQALRLHRETGERRGENEVLGYLALLSYLLGEKDRALTYSQEALQTARAIRDPLAQGQVLLHKGHIMLGEGLPAEAAAAYDQALALYREDERPGRIAAALGGLAQAALAQGNLAQARAYADEILGDLEPHISETAGAPHQVYLPCYHVLRASQDPRAHKVLEKGYRLLKEQADKIEDEELRHSFLENVAIHREIVREWNDLRDRRRSAS